MSYVTPDGKVFESQIDAIHYNKRRRIVKKYRFGGKYYTFDERERVLKRWKEPEPVDILPQELFEI